MSIIDDIAQHLHNQGIGTLGTNLFKSSFPDDVAQTFIIGVFDTGGVAPDTYLPIDNPTFQVSVKSTTYTVGQSKLEAIKNALHQTANSDLGVSNSSYYYYIHAQSNGGHIGKTPLGWDEFSINFICKKR
ncbi:MAG: hypothetical protein MOGMAGMI_01793 [Candidatus Omnitrophica bacterium]|nr:hypothetical protein [Candidatus Omnitrophota bacterium]